MTRLGQPLAKTKQNHNTRILMIIVIENTPVCKVGLGQQVEVREALPVGDQRACKHRMKMKAVSR